jgi:aminoglycoside phosphotransferase (APT) family kinase protein
METEVAATPPIRRSSTRAAPALIDAVARLHSTDAVIAYARRLQTQGQNPFSLKKFYRAMHAVCERLGAHR